MGKFSFVAHEPSEEVERPVTEGLIVEKLELTHEFVPELLDSYGTVFSIYNSARQWDSCEGVKCVSGTRMCLQDYLP